MTDKKLDKMLERYCAAEPETSFEYKPSHKRAGDAAFSAKNRMIAAAAVIALISAVGITAYMLFGNRFDVSTAVTPIQPPTIATEPESNPASENSAVNAPTEHFTSAASAAAAQTASQSETSATDAQGLTDTVTVDRIGEAEISDHRSGSVSPPPTQQPAPTSTEAPAQPTEKPTDEPPLTRPTERELVGVSFSGVVDSNMLTGSGNVYSRIFDDKGQLLGGSDAFSADRLAVIVSQDDNSASVQYTVPEDLLYKDGYYNIVFYNEDGKRLAQGQLYIEMVDNDEDI